VDALGVGHVGALVDGDDIADAHAEVVAHDAVHANLLHRAVVLGQHNADLFVVGLREKKMGLRR
jgi:hypothetical protein